MVKVQTLSDKIKECEDLKVNSFSKYKIKFTEYAEEAERAILETSIHGYSDSSVIKEENKQD
jgi:hypothetical protein